MRICRLHSSTSPNSLHNIRYSCRAYSTAQCWQCCYLNFCGYCSYSQNSKACLTLAPCLDWPSAWHRDCIVLSTTFVQTDMAQQQACRKQNGSQQPSCKLSYLADNNARFWLEYLVHILLCLSHPTTAQVKLRVSQLNCLERVFD